jgi:hypothetical protein
MDYFESDALGRANRFARAVSLRQGGGSLRQGGGSLRRTRYPPVERICRVREVSRYRILVAAIRHTFFEGFLPPSFFLIKSLTRVQISNQPLEGAHHEKGRLSDFNSVADSCGCRGR